MFTHPKGPHWIIKGFALVFAAIVMLSGMALSDVVEMPEEEEMEIAGADWRTWRAYSEGYALTDEWTVTLSPLDEHNGYAAYEANTGTRIGSLVFPDRTLDDVIHDGVIIDDRSGDGVNDIGVSLVDGEVMWFSFMPDEIGSWPENTMGCFPYFATEALNPPEIDHSLNPNPIG